MSRLDVRPPVDDRHGQRDAQGQRDFFVSYTGADLPWARWIAWELEAAGYTTMFQEWDFQAGANFVLEMHRAAQKTHHTIAVLSPHYLEALYTQPEWAAALVGDPAAAKRRLIPVRIEDCQPEGLLRGIVYINLAGLDEAQARARLRERITGTLRGRSKPTTAPAWPTPAPAMAGTVTPAVALRPRFATVLPPVWNLPYRRNSTFTGREAELTALARQLGQVRTAAVTQAIQGGGGIGKTTLAAEYAWRHRADFEAVWWVRAEQPASLVGDYAELATALGLPEAALPEQQAVVRAVRRWLEGHDRWLLVLDNAEGPQAATGLLPPLAHLVDLLPQAIAEHGQVLITTRDASWEQETPLVDLDLLTPEEAVRFLLARSSTGTSDQPAAAQVATALGYLPLALEQAGAYVAETRIGLAAYLERLRRFPALALAKGRPRDRDPADTVASTWQVSLERVRPVVGAVTLLEVCAFLAPEEIPRELFAQPLEEPNELRELAADPFALDEAVAALRRYGLVKATEDALTMHRLLQQVVRDRLDPDTVASRAGLAVRLLEAAFPGEGYREPRLWPAAARLLSHALAAADQAEQRAAEPDATASLLSVAGGYLLDRARFREARGLLERALALTEATYGPDHPETAGYLRSLGQVVGYLGDSALARQHLERALAIDQAAYGPDHPELVVDLLRLGQLLPDLGDLALARQHLERALTLAEAAHGPDHRMVAIILLSRGRVLRRLGDLALARQQFERTLAILEAAWGADHAYVATALRELGRVLHDLGDLAAARRHLERALAIFQAAQGSDHIDVGSAMAELGLVLRDLGDLAAARRHLERALAIQEAIWGPDHPEVAYFLADLGLVLRDLGDLAAARRHLERALAIRQTALGPRHSDTKATARALADLES
jgi:tetratricopeptide (TPR) repeat protein